MSYLLGGSNGESNTFETVISNSAIEVAHETSNLVAYTNVVAPNQGNTYKMPSLAPVTFEDYDESTDDPDFQSPALGAKEITATAAVATTEFGIFEGWTASFDLAAGLGGEIGMSYAEKVDQRVAGAFKGFKATTGNTNYTVVGGDGFDRVSAIGAVELLAAGATPKDAGVSATSVLGAVRLVAKQWRKARLPGRPIIVLGEDEEQRLLGELTAVEDNGLSALGNELLQTGMIRNVYGCSLVFTTFLATDSRTSNEVAAQTVKVGAAIGPMAITTVIKQNLAIEMGKMPKGLKMWLTGTGYFGSGVSHTARGMAINIA